jgi:hypothetical protein
VSRGPHIRKKPRREPQWPARLFAIAVGGFLTFAGLYGFHNQRYWITGYNPELGHVATGPVLWRAILGILILLIGIMPWAKTPWKPRKEHKWRTHI